MEGLSVEILARRGYCLFRRFRACVAYDIIQNNVLINTREDYKMYVGKKEYMLVMSKQ
jgi:hypothetical protein